MSSKTGRRHWISGSITAAMNTEAITRERDIKESLADMDIPKVHEIGCLGIQKNVQI